MGAFKLQSIDHFADDLTDIGNIHVWRCRLHVKVIRSSEPLRTWPKEEQILSWTRLLVFRTAPISFRTDSLTILLSTISVQPSIVKADASLLKSTGRTGKLLDIEERKLLLSDKPTLERKARAHMTKFVGSSCKDGKFSLIDVLVGCFKD